jgi:2-polyprenyl-3-methyl-5-hydroxy-6-metoxy-1,4-benzoquinol methylase
MSLMIDRKEKCPVCESRLLTQFLSREQVPVHQNLVMKDQQSAIEITRGDLNLVLCGECGFAFNQSFEPSKLSYGEDYDNTQTCSFTFNEYLDGLVWQLLEEKGVQNSHILEIGCGKGLFLRKLVQAEGARNIGYGFDPSYIGPAVDLGGRLRFEKCFYGPECADVPADVVICRHVIEHVPEPLELLHTIRQALTNAPNARVFFETPCVEWILRNQIIWDLFYEHCSYFTAESLTTAFEASGFRVTSVWRVFGRQYLWLEAAVSPEKPEVTRTLGSMVRLADQFAASESRLRKDWEAKIRELASEGRIALWGAGAKGVTFANLLDPERERIACVVDLNPQKQGYYVPGTGHPIVSYEELADYNVTTAILMNPNYRAESLALLQGANLDISLIQVI